MKEQKLIFKRDHLDRIPERWRRQYGKGFYLNDQSKQDIQRRLDGLTIGKFMAEEADEIIGNSSWSAFNCDMCGEDKDVLMHMGDEPDYEAQWLDCCRECLVKAIRKF